MRLLVKMRKLSKQRCFMSSVFILISTIFYLEVFSYYTNTLKWHKPKCNNHKHCIKILLVADPQIIGNHDDVSHFLVPFTIFDSDRYLKRTYLHAYNFVDPDVIIFLGDLMDEGSSANDKEFYNYVRRIFNIFLLEYTSKNIQYIWLPGDNDVGGEGPDRITGNKLKRFNRAFAQPDLISFKNVTFFKINRLVNTIPIYKQKREFYDVSNIFVGLSHIPMMFIPSIFVDKVFSKMLPQVLFTAHEHKSMIVSTDALLRQDRQIVPVTPNNNIIFEYTLGITDMYEFIIPTCSYRMGTDKIGYGFAIIENNELQYTVLWSPSRFVQLKTYLVVFAILFLIGIIFKIRNKIL